MPVHTTAVFKNAANETIDNNAVIDLGNVPQGGGSYCTPWDGYVYITAAGDAGNRFFTLQSLTCYPVEDNRQPLIGDTANRVKIASTTEWPQGQNNVTLDSSWFEASSGLGGILPLDDILGEPNLDSPYNFGISVKAGEGDTPVGKYRCWVQVYDGDPTYVVRTIGFEWTVTSNVVDVDAPIGTVIVDGLPADVSIEGEALSVTAPIGTVEVTGLDASIVIDGTVVNVDAPTGTVVIGGLAPEIVAFPTPVEAAGGGGTTSGGNKHYYLLQAPTSESTDTPEDLAADEARRVRGFVPQGRSLISADGRVKVNSTPIISGKPVLGHERFHLKGRKINATTDTLEARTVAKCGGAVWLDVSANGSGDFRPVAARTEGVREHFTPYGEWMYLSNGTDPVVRLDGNFYATGTASCSGAFVIGYGTSWLDNTDLTSSDTVEYLSTECSLAPGDKIFFKVLGVWEFTPYTIAQILTNNTIKLMEVGPTTTATDYIIVRSHLSGITMPEYVDNGSYTVAEGGDQNVGLLRYRYILKNPRTGVISNASSQSPEVFVTASGRATTVDISEHLVTPDPQASEIGVYRTKGADGWADPPRVGGLISNHPANGGLEVLSSVSNDGTAHSVEIVGTVYDPVLGSPTSLVVEDCEAAWTTTPDASQTTSTIKKVGTYSRLFTVPRNGTGSAYKTLAAPVDMSGYSQIAVWVRPVSTNTYGIGQFHISENADLSSPSESFVLPPLYGGIWRRLVFTFVNTGASRNAIQSVGFTFAAAHGQVGSVYVDDVEVLGTSTNNGDPTGGRVTRRELISLNGVTAVPSAFTDWDQVLGFREYPAGQTWTGTITLRQSNHTTVVSQFKTVAATGIGTPSNFCFNVDLTAYAGIPRFLAIGGVTEGVKVGVKGVDHMGQTVYGSATLSVGVVTDANVDLVSLDTIYYGSVRADTTVALLPTVESEGIFYYVKTVQRDPVTYQFTGFTDTAGDYKLTELMPSSDGREPPPAFSTLILWDSRLVGWGYSVAPYRGRKAVLGGPEYWPEVQVDVLDDSAGGFVDFGTRGSAIMAMVPEAGAYQTNGLTGSCLLVATSTGDIWRWYSQSIEYAYRGDIVSGASLQNCAGIMVWLARHGLNAAPAGGHVVSPINRAMTGLIPESVADPVVANLAKSSAVYFDGAYYMTWAQDGADNNQILVYRPGQQGGYSGLLPESVDANIHSFTVWEDGSLYASDGVDGYIWRLLDRTNGHTYWNPDNLSGMPVEIWFKNITLASGGAGEIFQKKHMRRIVFCLECDTDDQNLVCEVYTNGNDVTPARMESKIIKGHSNRQRTFVIFRPEMEARVFSVRIRGTFTRRVRYIWGQILFHTTSEQEGIE